MNNISNENKIRPTWRKWNCANSIFSVGADRRIATLYLYHPALILPLVVAVPPHTSLRKAFGGFINVFVDFCCTLKMFDHTCILLFICGFF